MQLPSWLFMTMENCPRIFSIVFLLIFSVLLVILFLIFHIASGNQQVDSHQQNSCKQEVFGINPVCGLWRLVLHMFVSGGSIYIVGLVASTCVGIASIAGIISIIGVITVAGIISVVISIARIISVVIPITGIISIVIPIAGIVPVIISITRFIFIARIIPAAITALRVYGVLGVSQASFKGNNILSGKAVCPGIVMPLNQIRVPVGL